MVATQALVLVGLAPAPALALVGLAPATLEFWVRFPNEKSSLVRDGQTSPHRTRLVVSRSTCPPLSLATTAIPFTGLFYGPI